MAWLSLSHTLSSNLFLSLQVFISSLKMVSNQNPTQLLRNPNDLFFPYTKKAEE